MRFNVIFNAAGDYWRSPVYAGSSLGIRTQSSELKARYPCPLDEGAMLSTTRNASVGLMRGLLSVIEERIRTERQAPMSGIEPETIALTGRRSA